jgi:hypothetical protein
VSREGDGGEDGESDGGWIGLWREEVAVFGGWREWTQVSCHYSSYRISLA